jgi:hypothetical protein
MDLRVRALESVLVDKGYVDPAALDELIDTYETRIGPRNGARVVARAWVDPSYRDWLLSDATAAIARLGYTGPASRRRRHLLPPLAWCTRRPVGAQRHRLGRNRPFVIQSALTGARSVPLWSSARRR